jgi:hypothetical protein
MKVTTWAVLGSVLITVMLAVLVAAGFGAAPPAYGCSGAHPEVRAAHPQVHSTTVVRNHHSSLVAVRMGWAVS